MSTWQRKPAQIFVAADNSRFLETQVEAQKQIFDLNAVQPASLLKAYREKQKHFSTAPVDADGQLLRFFPGGYSIWSGWPGSGKTTLLRQLACHLLRSQDSNPFGGPGVFVCSLEEDPADVFLRHVEVACGVSSEHLTEGMVQWCSDLWGQRLKLWNYRPIEEDAQYRKIFAATRIFAREHNVRHVILDSLMCVDVPENDNEAQRQFAVDLARCCAAAGVHVHLVAHPRKPSKTTQEHDTSEVAGSSNIGRKADNVIFVKRAADEEHSVHSNGKCTPMEIRVTKQRYGTGWIGGIRGWFNRELRQYVSDPCQPHPTQYLPDMAVSALSPQKHDNVPRPRAPAGELEHEGRTDETRFEAREDER